MNPQAVVVLNKRTKKIMQGETELKLTAMQYALLRYFLKNPGVLLKKSDIIDNVWPEDVAREGVSDEALYQLIRLVRGRLAEKAPNVTYIETWPRQGYCFVPSTTKHMADALLNVPTILAQQPIEPAVMLNFLRQIYALAEQTLQLYDPAQPMVSEKAVNDTLR